MHVVTLHEKDDFMRAFYEHTSVSYLKTRTVCWIELWHSVLKIAMRLFDMELSTCFSMKGFYCVLLLVVVAGFDVVGGG